MKWVLLAIILTTSGDQQLYAFGPRWDTSKECQFAYYSEFPLLIRVLKDEYGPNAKVLNLSCIPEDMLKQLEIEELEV